MSRLMFLICFPHGLNLKIKRYQLSSSVFSMCGRSGSEVLTSYTTENRHWDKLTEPGLKSETYFSEAAQTTFTKVQETSTGSQS